MKKIAFFAFSLIALLLCSCGAVPSDSALSLKDKETEKPSDTLQPSGDSLPDQAPSSFTIGGILVSASDGLDEAKTGTELTNAAEKLLAEKYGETFCCEQYLYQEEFSLRMNLTAYPKANPKLKFDLDVCGRDTLELWWDKYYNELYRDEIDAYLYPSAEPFGIEKEQFFVQVNDMITTPEISAETFYQKSVRIFLAVPEEKALELHGEISELAQEIYARLRNEETFWIELCEEGMTCKEDFRYDRIFRNYSVSYLAYNDWDSEDSSETLSIASYDRSTDQLERWTVPASEETVLYTKPASEEDIILDWDSGVYYVRDQIMVSAALGTPPKTIYKLAEELDAEIVGYIELIDNYQLEFHTPKSYAELKEIIESVKALPYIDYASFNYATPLELN